MALKNGLLEEAQQKAKEAAKLSLFRKLKHPEEIETAAKRTNPKYGEIGFDNNCQRCVVAYLLRRLGYDVTARKCPEIDIFDEAGANGSVDRWTLAFTSFKFEQITPKKKKIPTIGDYMDSIRRRVESEGDGAKFIFRFKTKHSFGGGGHVAIIENLKGKLIFVDPQDGTVKTPDFNTIILETMAVVNATTIEFSKNIFNLVQ